MAIQNYCLGCKNANPLDAKKCRKCGATFTKDNRKFRVDVSVKGQRITRMADNLTLARELEASIKADMLRQEFDVTVHKAKKKAMTLGELWSKHYLPWAKEHKKSWHDDEWYFNRHLESRFGAKALDAITALDIERMKLDLKKGTSKNGRPYAAATIKHQIVILRRLFNLACKWGLHTGSNPVASVQIPKLDNEITEFLSEDELRRLFEVLHQWPFADTASFIKFAILTGFRQGELIKLTWDDVDLERSLITLRDPKGTKTETLPISQEALGVLREIPATHSLIFPGPGGKPKAKSTVRLAWNRIKKAAGISADFRFHGLRHSYASWLVSNGVDLAVVQKLMTHKHATTTQRYAHLMPGAVKDAAAKSGKLFSAVSSTMDNVVELVKN